MRFEPSDEQLLVQKTARQFAEQELLPRAEARDRTGEFPEREVRALGALGLLGMSVPEAYGGAEVGPVGAALAMTEIARGDASVAVTMSVTNMVAETIARFGNEDQKRAWLPRLCAGEIGPAAFALSEPQAGSDSSGIQTVARRTAGGYALTGSKQWITSGDRAAVTIVMAKHGADEQEKSPDGRPRISAFLVPKGTAGLSVGRAEKKMGLRGSSTVPLTFDNMALPESARLGAEGDGLKVALTALDGGRINIAAQALGIARGAFETAVRYTGERRQFGQALHEFQAIKFMIADAGTYLAAGELMVLDAAWRKQRQLPYSRQAAEAKVFATEKAFEVCDKAIQMMGGYGYTREFPVERLLRDVRVTTIYEGTSQVQRIVIARAILKEAHA